MIIIEIENISNTEEYLIAEKIRKYLYDNDIKPSDVVISSEVSI